MALGSYIFLFSQYVNDPLFQNKKDIISTLIPSMGWLN
jgi:hypothetical protein